MHRAPDRSAIILTDLAGRTVKFRRVRGVVGSNPADTTTFQIGLLCLVGLTLIGHG